jgi:hypothetical protein
MHATPARYWLETNNPSLQQTQGGSAHQRRRAGLPGLAQVLVDATSERSWLRLVGARLGHLFPYVPQQPGYNKRLRALAPTICQVLRELVAASPSVCDRVRLLDSTPVPCGASRETVKRSDLAGYAAYGYCASHSRYFWGFRLYLLTTPTGCPSTSRWPRPTNPNTRSPQPCSSASR